MAGACRLRQFWRFNLILTYRGGLGRTFGTHIIYITATPVGGGCRAKPGISSTWASATCPEREHASKIATHYLCKQKCPLTPLALLAL